MTDNTITPKHEIFTSYNSTGDHNTEDKGILVWTHDGVLVLYKYAHPEKNVMNIQRAEFEVFRVRVSSIRKGYSKEGYLTIRLRDRRVFTFDMKTAVPVGVYSPDITSAQQQSEFLKAHPVPPIQQWIGDLGRNGVYIEANVDRTDRKNIALMSIVGSIVVIAVAVVIALIQ